MTSGVDVNEICSRPSGSAQPTPVRLPEFTGMSFRPGNMSKRCGLRAFASRQGCAWKAFHQLDARHKYLVGTGILF